MLQITKKYVSERGGEKNILGCFAMRERVRGRVGERDRVRIQGLEGENETCSYERIIHRCDAIDRERETDPKFAVFGGVYCTVREEKEAASVGGGIAKSRHRARELPFRHHRIQQHKTTNCRM